MHHFSFGVILAKKIKILVVSSFGSKASFDIDKRQILFYLYKNKGSAGIYKIQLGCLFYKTIFHLGFELICLLLP